MEQHIVVDSCCDLTPELRENLRAQSVPLSMTLGDAVYVDDDTLDLPDYMEKMRKYTGRIGSACPSPQAYKEAFLKSDSSFAVTLSCHLSGSYDSAMAGRAMAEEEGAQVHVFDSKSASAGELLIALKLRKLIDDACDREHIISTISGFIRKMETYFVLDNLDNLIKNGRLHKITGRLLSALNIKPILGSDGDGNITLFSHARGPRQILDKMLETVAKSGRAAEADCIVISHCNNPGLAEQLKAEFQKLYHFKDIVIVPTGGLSSMYANDKGVILAF